MSPKIGYHVVEISKVSCREVYRIALFCAIIITAPFPKFAPDAGIYVVPWSHLHFGFFLRVHGVGYRLPRE